MFQHERGEGSARALLDQPNQAESAMESGKWHGPSTTRASKTRIAHLDILLRAVHLDHLPLVGRVGGAHHHVMLVPRNTQVLPEGGRAGRGGGGDLQCQSQVAARPCLSYFNIPIVIPFKYMV